MEGGGRGRRGEEKKGEIKGARKVDEGGETGEGMREGGRKREGRQEGR